MPLQGESFLQAEARRKREDKARAKELAKTDSSPQAKAWAAPRSIFLAPPLIAKPPKAKPKMTMPGTRYTGPPVPPPTREQELGAMTRSARERRKAALGLKTAKQAPNISDAVETGDEIRRRKAQPKIDKLADPPFQIRADPAALLRWKKGRIQALDISPADKRDLLAEARGEHALLTRPPDPFRAGMVVAGVGRRAGEAVAGKVADVAAGVAEAPGNLIEAAMAGAYGGNARPGSIVPPSVQRAGAVAQQLPGAKPFTGMMLTPAERNEAIAEGIFGKSIVNEFKNPYLPRGWGQVGGLAAGVLTIGPAGKVVRAGAFGGKATLAAIRAGEGLRAALAAGGEMGTAAYHGPSATGQVIRWAQGNRKTLGKLSPTQVTAIRDNADAVLAERDAARAAGDHAYADQLDSILRQAGAPEAAGAVVGPHPFKFTEAEQATNLNRRLNIGPIKYGNARRVDEFGIPFAGKVTPEEGIARMKHATPSASQRAHDASFYTQVRSTLSPIYEDKEIMAWLASQVGASPARGVLDLMRVMDRIAAGEEIPTAGPGSIGLAAKAMESILKGEVDLSKGAKAKISDFIDTALGKQTRNWTGHHPKPPGALWGDPRWGGAPAVADRWGGRSVGLVDKDAVAQIKARFGVDVEQDITGSGLSEIQYEQVSKFYHDMTDVMNASGFDGRSDWIPGEVQAMDWAAIQRYWGVQPEDLRFAVDANKRRFSLQVGQDLTPEEASRVAEQLAPHVEKILAEAGGSVLPVGRVQAGAAQGAKDAAANASLHFEVMSSPEQAQRLVNRLARVFDKYAVTASKVGGDGAKRHLRISGIPDEETAARVYASLNAQDPKLFKNGFSFSGGEMHLKMPGKPVTAVEMDSFGESLHPFLTKAEQELDLPPLEYRGTNLQTLEGKSGADLQGVGSRGNALERRTDAQARKALDAAVAGAERSRLRRVAARASQAVNQPMGIVPPGTVGPGFQRVMEAAKDLPAPPGAKPFTPPPGVHTPEGAFDQCKQVSSDCVSFLRSQGIDAEWVQLAGMKSEELPVGSPWHDIPAKNRVHYVAKVGDEYIDYAARQFDPQASVPQVLRREDWDREYNITDALPAVPTPPPPARSARFVSEALPRTPEQVSQRIVALDSELDPVIDNVARGLKKEGLGKGMSRSGAKTGKPAYFNSFGDYEAAKTAEYDKRVARFKQRNPGQSYPGAHFTDAWPEWGEDPNVFRWGDADTYAIGKDAEIAVEQNMAWYREQAEGQLTRQLATIAARGGEDGAKARRLLIKFQERDSLRSLEAKNKGAALFPEDVPAAGYGQDLRIVARHPTPVSEEARLREALRPPSVPAARPTRVNVSAGGRRTAVGGTPPPPPVRPVARQLPSPEFDKDFLEKVMAQIRKELPSAKPVREEQLGLQSEERARRLATAMHEWEKGGVEAAVNIRKALHGVLPRLEWGAFEFLDQDAYDALVQHVLRHPGLRDWEKVRVRFALDKAMKKGVPTKSEHALFERAFGKTTADNLGDPANLHIMLKLYQWGLDIWNTPRSIMASFDLSAPFRQGLVAGARHPLIFGKNWNTMARSAKSEDYYLAMMDDIANSPNYHRYEVADLAILDAHASGAGREEAYRESLAEKIPGLKIPIKGSTRGYSAFLTKLRTDIFDHMIEVAQAAGKDINDEKFLKALGEYINTSTGRGTLPGKTLKNSADLLNATLFSPRLLASRFQILNPYYYGKLYGMDPFVARQQARAAIQTLGGMAATLTLASQIPGVTVNMNPTNSDFGQIRFGDTRIDIAGGFRPLLVLYFRFARGETTASSTGVTRKLGGYGGTDRWGLLGRFMEGKMAPSPGLVRDILHDRKTFVGEPLTARGTAWNMLIPLGFQGAKDVLESEGIPAATIGLILSSIGFGVSSYPDKTPSGGGGGMPLPDDFSGGGGSEMPLPPGFGGGGGGEQEMPLPAGF